MSKSIIKKAVKKALQETGLFSHIKVWTIEIDEDYVGRSWINIESSGCKKKTKKNGKV